MWQYDSDDDDYDEDDNDREQDWEFVTLWGQVAFTDDGDADGELADLKLSNCEIASWVTEDYTDIASNCRQFYPPSPLVQVQVQHH